MALQTRQTLQDLRKHVFEVYYGMKYPDNIFDVIDPGEKIGTSSGYTLTKRAFADPDFLRGFELCCPLEIQRGDVVRYARKKKGVYQYFVGGTVKWVDGMLPEGVEWDQEKYKKSKTYREEMGKLYTKYTRLRRPKYISLWNSRDPEKKWSIQLNKTTFFWRMPALTQQERQKLVSATEIAETADVDPMVASELIKFAKYITEATSEELFQLAEARKREEGK